MSVSRVLVTGGSGMVGRSLQDIYPDARYVSSSEYDLTSEKHVEKMYLDIRPTSVVHLAAKAGGIIDNMKKPAEYFTDNILINTLVVEYARKNRIYNFIGILSTCIYPDVVDTYPMTEDMLHLGPPAKTNFSYGYAKRSLAVQIDAYNKQYGSNWQYLTPCNLYGEYDKYGDNSYFVAALIKKIHEAKEEGRDEIVLFGTGEPLRQFMHSKDLARVIKMVINNSGIGNESRQSFNVATSNNLSIKEIAEIALRACDATHLKITFDGSKPDGQFRKDVSNKKMLDIFPGFEFTDLEDGIRDTYNKIKENESIYSNTSV